MAEQIVAYKSKDGKLFQTRAECVTHEFTIWPGQIEKHIMDFCSTTYDDDNDESHITASDVCDYILAHWKDIIAMFDQHGPINADELLNQSEKMKFKVTTVNSGKYSPTGSWG